MAVKDFPARPQGAPPDSVSMLSWLDALGNRQSIDNQQELTSVATGDEIAIFDVSETGNVKTKKATVANIASGAGAVIGPASSTDNAAVRFDSTTGKLVQNSAFIIDDSGHVTSFGGQIKFPATQAASADANTLDDYEEGTFTPGISFGNGTTGITYSVQVGKYTKVGNLVTAFAYVILSAKGSSTGQSRLTGLPFTAANVTNVRTTCFQYFNGGAAAVTAPFCIVLENTSTGTLQNLTAGSGVGISDTGFTDTTATISTIPYYTS